MLNEWAGKFKSIIGRNAHKENGLLKSWASARNWTPPQRFNDNYKRYVDRGGKVEPDKLLAGFIAGNEANQGDMARFHFFCLVFDQIIKEGLDGDVAELGVYKGNTATILARIARHLNTTAWLFDTFEGFSTNDLAGIDADKKMEFSDTSLEAVRSLVGEKNTRFVKGFFPDTAARLPADASFCLVHIDCDLYAPFKAALDYFYGRLVPGGFLVMHDYSSLHWDGAERAVDEFFADKPESIVPVPDGAGSVVMRKLRQGHPVHNWRAQGRTDGFAKRWLDAGKGEIANYLTTGWSDPEDWGIWGIGPSHSLQLSLDAPPAGDLAVEADVSATLIGPRTMQEVDVWVGEDHIDTWRFTPEENRGVRSLLVPRSAITDDRSYPTIALTFRPRHVESPHSLDPAIADDRLLGVALYRLRQRVMSPKSTATNRPE
jgi:hypothetical protein